MTRSLALWGLGLWLGLLAASWAMASVNFRTVDRVLGRAAATGLDSRLAPLAPADRRMVLRHMASEINRWMFLWGTLAQLALAGVIAAATWRGAGVPRTLALAALAIVVLQLAVLAPAIASLGRSLDFLPRPLPPGVARRFGLLHAGYVGLDLLKAALVVTVAVRLARRG